MAQRLSICNAFRFNLIYFNDLHNHNKVNNIIQHADGTTVSFKGHQQSNLELNTFTQINSACQYFSYNNVKVNSVKTKCMIFMLNTELNKLKPYIVLDKESLEVISSI